MKFYPLFPILLTLLSLAVGLFLLTRRRRKITLYALAGSALLQSLMSFFLFMSIRDLPFGIIDVVYLKWGLLFASLSPVFLVVFCVYHIRIETPLFPGIKKVTVPAVSILGPFFALLVFHPSFLQKVDVVSGKWILSFGPIGTYFSVYLILSLLVILFQMEQTFRLTQKVQRHQLNFLVLGITAGSLYSLFIASFLLLFRSLYLDLLIAGVLIYTICWGMIIFAVIRYRLLEVDIFVSRHVVFASAAAFGVGLYLLLTGALGFLVRKLGGHWDILLSTVFVSTTLILLAVILLSSTLQRTLKRFINVHFYRYKYDYRLEWNEFTKKISKVHDLPNLLLKIIEMITETIWVNQVSIWLYNERSGRLSFSISRNLPKKAGFLKKEDLLVQYLLHHEAPLNIKDPNSQNIVASHKNLFKRLNACLVIPLKIGARLVGMITIGPEMKGAEYTDEDCELLMTIALQASNAIFSSQLIEEVAAVKEAESFNKISSFLVHDLKNLVSSLSLALQNADRNINKPEFQKDLLATIVKTVAKMKHLIANLSTLPKELEIKKTPVDLNRLIQEALENSKVATLKGIDLSTDLNELPSVQADGEYINKMLVNLILNAVQSLPESKGRIEIGSSLRDGYVHVEVLDTGVGMSEKFLRHGLFKPFTTTKKKGLGIGLYQCKTIMEAHGGNIEASSILNRGSQFVLKFPVD